MYKYFITTDATADLPKQFAEEDFAVVSMTYLLEDTVYECVYNDESTDDFYSKIEKGAMPTTSQTNIEDGKAFFRDILVKGFDIVHVCFSSALSSTYENMTKAAAELIAEEFPDRKLTVIDSRSASGGEGYYVWKLLGKRKEGASYDELVKYAEDIKMHVNHFFTVEDLHHLQRGGRCTKGEAFIGSALQLKPVLFVDELGRLIPVAKVLGRRAAMRAMVDKFMEKSQGYENETIFVCHGSCRDDAVWVADKIKQKCPSVKEAVVDYIGPIIGTHCGKGVLAVFFMGREREK